MSTTIEKPAERCCPPMTSGVERTDGTRAESQAMPMCPMARMCEGMMKPGEWGSWVLLLPGVILVAAGLLVILVPKAIAWMLGATAILVGLGFLYMATRFRKLMSGFRSA